MNPGEPLKIVFMGTPDFAVPSLEILAGSRHHIQAVVTVPDKPQGRGRSVQASAVKKSADKLGLDIYQPASLKDPSFRSELESLAPDVIVVVAFRILPESIFSIPRHGAFNLHASLLPRYRGAAPIHWALLNGDRETGLTTFFLKRKVDTGNIIRQKEVPILPEDNLSTLYEKLRIKGAYLVLETVELVAAGTFIEMEQDNSVASPAPKVTSATQQLDFTESNVRCANRVRAFAPKPGAYTFLHGKRLKILKAEISDIQGEAGVIADMEVDSFTVGCGEGALRIKQIQPEGKKVMDVSAFLLGSRLSIGDSLGQHSS
ncbi:MAG: methionyl-tRNA formyltransferase [Candidatus Marinimicrobia bacterium]|nr:methionyl-tRNA formyltransferase [Candidatus Neomarinimicrobiota bacterium]MCF7904586.1 methionyl-tRNA formyltransferase [Candidatus Neomarinimicrobiota bacterium]